MKITKEDGMQNETVSIVGNKLNSSIQVSAGDGLEKYKDSQLISGAELKRIEEMLKQDDTAGLGKVKLCRKHWKMFGRSIKKEDMEKPIDQKNIWIGAFRKELKLIKLYGYGQTRPKRDSNLSPPKPIDVVIATMLVNQAAKRYRDMASTCYNRRLHGFAGSAKQKKEDLYCLKDRGIVHCHNNAIIKYEGIHGGFALYRSTDGVNSFHSKLIPESVEIDDVDLENPIKIEAKPAKKGYRLKDAIFTLEALSSDKTGFKHMPSPSYYDDNEHCHPWYHDDDDSEQDEWGNEIAG